MVWADVDRMGGGGGCGRGGGLPLIGGGGPLGRGGLAGGGG